MGMATWRVLWHRIVKFFLLSFEQQVVSQSPVNQRGIFSFLFLFHFPTALYSFIAPNVYAFLKKINKKQFLVLPGIFKILSLCEVSILFFFVLTYFRVRSESYSCGFCWGEAWWITKSEICRAKTQSWFLNYVLDCMLAILIILIQSCV